MNNLTPEQLAFRAGYEQGRFDAQVEQETRPYRLLQNNGSKYFGESWDKPEQPAQRTWVGLTDEEFQMIYDIGRTPAGMMELVEAKLKDKNSL